MLDFTPQPGSQAYEVYAAVQTAYIALQTHRTRQREYEDKAATLGDYLASATIETTTVEAFAQAQARHSLLVQTVRACTARDLRLVAEWQYALRQQEEMQRAVRRAAEAVTSTDPLVEAPARQVARAHLAALIQAAG